MAITNEYIKNLLCEVKERNPGESATPARANFIKQSRRFSSALSR